jgi:hypothetical protein
MFGRMRNLACSMSAGFEEMKPYPLQQCRSGARMRSRRLRGVAMSFLLAASVCSLQALSSVTFAWDANPEPDIVGYVLYSGQQSGSYTERSELGNVTQTTVTDLQPGMTYYFSIAALNDSGLESDPSAEIRYAVPLTSPSRPRLLSIASPAPRKVTLQWTSVPGSTYRVAAKTDLSGGTWADISQNIVANGSITTWTGSVSSTVTSRFFVIHLLSN